MLGSMRKSRVRCSKVEWHQNKWWCGIPKSQPDLKLRKPEPTAAIVRHQGMDQEGVKFET